MEEAGREVGRQGTEGQGVAWYSLPKTGHRRVGKWLKDKGLGARRAFREKLRDKELGAKGERGTGGGGGALRRGISPGQAHSGAMDSIPFPPSLLAGRKEHYSPVFAPGGILALRYYAGVE